MLAGAVAGLGNVPLSAAPPTHPLSQPEYSIATKIGYCAFPFIVTMPEGTRYLRVRKTEQWAPAAMRIEMPDGPVELRVEGGWGTPPPHRENRLRRLAKWDHGKVFSYRPGEGSVFSMVYLPNKGWGQEWVEIRLLPANADEESGRPPTKAQIEQRWRAALDLIAPFKRCPIE